MEVKKATIKIYNVTIVSGSGEDTILFDIESKTAHPECGYVPNGKIYARKGYGVQWCRENLGVEPRVINRPS